MNASLDSPLEPLAIDYLSFGLLTAINNIWAWVAFITAAVGFWRIRGFSSPPRRGTQLSSLSYSSAEATAELEPVINISPPGVTNHVMPAPLKLTASYPALDSEGSPKGKFSVYYNDDLTGSGDGGGGCNGGGAAAEREELEWWCGDNWERAMVVRMGDMGWYRCQDLWCGCGIAGSGESPPRLWWRMVAWCGRLVQSIWH